MSIARHCCCRPNLGADGSSSNHIPILIFVGGAVLVGAAIDRATAAAAQTVGLCDQPLVRCGR
jgi:hypothetical protein